MLHCHALWPKERQCDLPTCQLAMQFIFGDMIHKELGDYVDAIIVKSKSRLEHRATLQCVIHRGGDYNLMLNPCKRIFGVSSD